MTTAMRTIVTTILCCASFASVSVAADDIKPWKFVCIPDLMNNDVKYPDPRWDDALDFVLNSIKNEDPDFVVVPGDLVMGRWSHNAEHLEKMADIYLPAWTRRMEAHGLKYYVAVGDHEIGDDPWQGDKRQLVPLYKQKFVEHIAMPKNGPTGFKGTTFYIKHKNLLLVAMDEFEQDADGNVHVRTGEVQQAWLRTTLIDHQDTPHRVVMGHVPVLPGWKARSSSRMSMPGGSNSPLWKIMAERKTDLYLCGEVHDITMQQRDNVLQVVSGSQPSNVPELNYLVVTVHPDRLDLEMKKIETILEGSDSTEHDPYGVDPYLKRIVRISEENKKKGMQIVGTMTINKAGGERFVNRSGIFETEYSVQDEPVVAAAKIKGELRKGVLPDEGSPRWRKQSGNANESIDNGVWTINSPTNWYRGIRFDEPTRMAGESGRVEINWATTSTHNLGADGLSIGTRGSRIRIHPLAVPDGEDMILFGRPEGMTPDNSDNRVPIPDDMDFNASKMNTYTVKWMTDDTGDVNEFELILNGRSLGTFDALQPAAVIPDGIGIELRGGESRIGGISWSLYQGGTPARDRAVDNARKLVADGKRQLFLDDVMVAHTAGVKRTLHQAKKYEGNPIIKRGQTEWNIYRTQLYGTVLYDPDVRGFKMWYLSGARFPYQEPITLDGQKRIPNYQLVGYAESEDGFNWELPNLGIVEYNGSKKNNICRIGRTNAEGVAVVYHPEVKDPNKRYKALYWEHSAGDPEPAPGISVMSASTSADGKTWKDHGDVIPYASDTGHQALWDPAIQKYVAYGRFNAGGRRVARAESEDFFKWSVPEMVFAADAGDPPATQIYGMGVGLYEGVYIGTPWIFDIGNTHHIDVELATSRDGKNWTRVAQGTPIIPNGPEGSWDHGICYTACGAPQVKGDTMFFFYSASVADHNYSNRAKEGTPEWFDEWKKIGTSIGVATLRRDGFVSMDAGDAEGQVTTETFTWPKGARLRINADATGGHVIVDVFDEHGERLNVEANARPITGDQIDTSVWLTAGDTDRIAGKEVQLRFRLKNASLYSWWLEK